MTRYVIIFPHVDHYLLIYELGEFDSYWAADEQAAVIMASVYEVFEESDQHMYEVEPIRSLKRHGVTIREDFIALKAEQG